MKPASIALAVRPRPLFEAVDLGTRMAQAEWRSVASAYGPAAAVVAMLAMASLTWNSWMPLLVVFMGKPWLDRALLQVYSRAAFGQTTSLTDPWVPGVLLGWRPVLLSLTTRRFSLWRAYTHAVEQLEGQRGAAASKRRRLLLAGRRFSMFSLQGLFSQLEGLFVLGGLALVAWAAPGLEMDKWMSGLMKGGDESALDTWSSVLYVGAALLIEPFYVASCFSCYLHRRVELEAWDLEQALRDAFLR